MNLPNSLVVFGKAAVQAQWSDKVTIDRDFLPLVNNKKQHIIIPNITCHFSQTSQPVLDQSSTVATTKSVFTLFVDTSVQLIAGDTLTIMHKGQMFIGVAGEPFNRTFSNGVKVEVTKVS
jgi:hypothetical protein